MKSQSLKTLKQLGKRGRSARASVGAIVNASLSHDVLRMLDHEAGAKAFRPEDIHQIRTSVRRLRSDLQFFGPVLDPSASRPLRDELRWLAGVLGAVRDLDVLELRLRDAVVDLGIVTPTDPIFEAIDERRGESRSRLTKALDGPRYASLRASIIAEARSPSLTEAADRPAASLLANRLARAWRRFLEDLEALPPDSPKEALHEFRKRAKRTRYAAESASGWLPGRSGKAARRIGRRAKQVQETLGLSQDAHVAIDFIQTLMPGWPDGGPSHDAVLLLIDRQLGDAEDVRTQYRSLRNQILND